MTVNAIDLELRVRAIARTFPDKIYIQAGEGCTYVPNRANPMGCIMGAALAPLGENLWDWDYHGGITQDDEERIDGPTQWLSNVQYRQDQGDSWARAVAYADALRAGLERDPDLD